MYQGELGIAVTARPRFLRELIEPALLALPNAGTIRRRNASGMRNSSGARRIASRALHGVERDLPGQQQSASVTAFRHGSPGAACAALSALDADPINRMLYADLKISSRRHALEGGHIEHAPRPGSPRSLLDPRVVELAFRIGGGWKIRHGRGSTSSSKPSKISCRNLSTVVPSGASRCR